MSGVSLLGGMAGAPVGAEASSASVSMARWVCGGTESDREGGDTVTCCRPGLFSSCVFWLVGGKL